MSNLFSRIDGTPYRHNARGANYPSMTTQTFTAATFAAVTIPTGTVGVMIDIPAGNTGTVVMKGSTGDTGIFLNPAGRNVMTFDKANLGFGLLCSSGVIINFWWV